MIESRTATTITSSKQVRTSTYDLLFIQENRPLFDQVILRYYGELLNKQASNSVLRIIQLGIHEVGDEYNVWAVIPAKSEETHRTLAEIQARLNGTLLRGKGIKLFTTYFYPEYQTPDIWQLPADYHVIYKAPQ